MQIIAPVELSISSARRSRPTIRGTAVATVLLAVGVILGAAAPAGAAITFSRSDYPVPSLTVPNRPAQPQGGGLNSVALADLNNDGKLDIVVADEGTGGVDVYLNHGDGTFAAQPGNPRPACGNNQFAGDIVAGQLNPQTDQNADVAVICNSDGTLVRLLGDGHGGLGASEVVVSPVSESLALGHLSASAGSDYVFGGPSIKACFTPVAATPGAGAQGDEQCDSTHADGSPLVTSFLEVPVHFYNGPCNNGDQVLYFPSGAANAGAFAAWDLDPRIGGGLGSNPCGTPFQSSTNRSSGVVSPDHATAMTAGDLNGDGEPDVVIADSGGGIHVVPWQGTSTSIDGGIPASEQPFSFPSGGAIEALGIADFGADGCPDIAASENVSTTVGGNDVEHNFVAIHSGHCNASQFDAAQTFDIGGASPGDAQDPSMAVGDLNGDGRPDVVTAAGYGPAAAVTVLLNTTAAPAAGGGGGTTGGGTGGAGGGTGGGGSTAPAIGSETLVPTAFRAAPNGLSALIALNAKRHYGTKVTYSLNENAKVSFSVVQPQLGRVARGIRCVKPTRANRKARKCMRLVAIPGGFTRTGSAGGNRFRFTGRIARHKLAPGKYQLIATPTANGHVGQPHRASFQIIK